jgi:hypothetical protein
MSKFVIPPDLTVTQNTAVLDTTFKVKPLEVFVKQKVVQTDYGPNTQPYVEFEFPNDGLYEFSDGFIEMRAQPFNSATGKTYVCFADWIGTIFARVWIGTDTEPIRDYYRWNHIQKFIKTHRDFPNEVNNQGVYLEGRGPQAGRITNAASATRYILPYNIPELTQTKWPMTLLSEPLKLRIYWEQPNNCIETDNIATGMKAHKLLN